MKTWTAYAQLHPENMYFLPTKGPQPDKEIDCCKNSVFNILHIGYRFNLSAKKETIPAHGLIGRTGAQSCKGKSYSEIDTALHEFFQALSKEGLPFATRLVRERVGLTTRDDNPDDVSLPPHFSKRQLYAKWCWSRGWMVVKKSTQKTSYASIKDFKPRPNDDDSEVPLWPQGSI